MHQYVLFILLALNVALIQNSPDDAKAIESAKNTSIRQIENSLPDKPFEKWLGDLVGTRTRIVWEVNDCGEQSGNPAADKARDFPMCVSALVDLTANRKLDVQLVVGTFKSGVAAGPASFHHAAVVTSSGQIEFIKSLSRLPEAIKFVR